MKRFLCTVLVLCLPALTQAAIIDTLRGFDDQDQDWSGQVELGIAASSGNSDHVSVSAGVRAQWLGSSHRLRLLAGYTRLSSNGTELDEEAMAHVRHNRRLRGGLHSLVFAQVQRNPFQRLESRTLLGAGLRLDLVDTDEGRWSVGAAHMVEFERLESHSSSDVHHRLSAFVSARLPLREGVDVNLTAFGQPRWSDWGDRRAVGQGSLHVALSKRVKLVVGLSIQHDSLPPPEVDSTDVGTRTSLSFDI